MAAWRSAAEPVCGPSFYCSTAVHKHCLHSEGQPDMCRSGSVAFLSAPRTYLYQTVNPNSGKGIKSNINSECTDNSTVMQNRGTG